MSFNGLFKGWSGGAPANPPSLPPPPLPPSDGKDEKQGSARYESGFDPTALERGVNYDYYSVS